MSAIMADGPSANPLIHRVWQKFRHIPVSYSSTDPQVAIESLSRAECGAQDRGNIWRVRHCALSENSPVQQQLRIEVRAWLDGLMG